MKEGGKILYFDSLPKNAAAFSHPTPADTSAEIEIGPREALAELVRIITENGQSPVTQLSGYLIAEDPTYLPEGGHARTLARRVGRDKLLETLIESYMESASSGSPMSRS